MGGVPLEDSQLMETISPAGKQVLSPTLTFMNPKVKLLPGGITGGMPGKESINVLNSFLVTIIPFNR